MFKSKHVQGGRIYITEEKDRTIIEVNPDCEYKEGKFVGWRIGKKPKMCMYKIVIIRKI